MKITEVRREGIEIVVCLVNYEGTEAQEIRLSEKEAEDLIDRIINQL